MHVPRAQGADMFGETSSPVLVLDRHTQVRQLADFGSALRAVAAFFGLVALELQAVARRGVRPDESAAPERDLRTVRFTRWLHYPVRFASLAGAGPVEKDLRRALG